MFRSHLTTALHLYDQGAPIRARVHIDRALVLADEQQRDAYAVELAAIKRTPSATAAATALRAVLGEVDAATV